MTHLSSASRPPSPPLAGLVARLSGYAAPDQPSDFWETAELVFPLVFNLGQPWRIRLGDQDRSVRVNSFTAGLYPGPVAVTCDAGAELLQVDLTPYGAARLFGGAAADLAGQVVELDAVDRFGGEYDAIHAQLFDAKSWSERFHLIEAFLAPRFGNAARDQIRQSWALLSSGHSVAQTAAEVGWSTRHLSTQFRRETGLRPVTATRMLRFHRACALAQRPDAQGWASIAAEAGYADQAHLIRDFREMAGEVPKVWAQRSPPVKTHLLG